MSTWFTAADPRGGITVAVMSELPIRPALDSIPVYQPGKPAASDGGPSYKLSSNENPFPPVAGVLESVVATASVMNRYPDMGVSALTAALARKYGVDANQVAVGAGSVAVLYDLLRATCGDGDEVVYSWRSFEAYPIAVGITGATSVTVPLDAESRHDLPAMAAAITDRTRVVVVCSPNNPTGPVVHAAELRELVAAVPPQVILIVDEAYRELVTDPDTVDGLELLYGRENVVVLRTFSKAYGLAGLRVGYGIGSPRLVEAIRKCALPFGVSQVAQAAALASLAAEDAMHERVEAIVKERARVWHELRDQGWPVPVTEANFVWLPLGHEAVAFATACAQRGLSVRPFDGDGVRVTIDEPAANDLFLKVAAAWLG
jgi:histidinol-phosphate aminotransferase